MNQTLIIVVLSVLLAIGNIRILYAADNETQDTSLSQNADVKVGPESTQKSAKTTAAPAPKPKPKITIKDSELCKKCKCDIDSLQIDCSNKSMAMLFSDVDWQTFQNADVFFETVKLDHNEISLIPVLPKYTVKYLYLSFNKINNISTGAFYNLTQLTVLDLSNNKLTSKTLKPHVFQGMYAADKYEPLSSLKTLNLAYNEMHTLNSNVFEHLPNLETLILCKNRFHAIDPSTTVAIGNLNSLKTLDLSYMELEDLPDTIFHSLNELETIILTGNLLKTLPDALAQTRHVKKLILDENPLSDIDKENTFKSLEELQYLSISYLPDVSKIGARALSDLQNLTTLVAINNPRLAQIHELAFTKNTSNPYIFDYPPLQKVLLHNNNLTRIERKWIVHWEKIAQLDLRRNPWTCDCTNSWLIKSLMKQINNTTPLLTSEVICASPLAWKNSPLIELADNNKEFVCETSANSENGSLIWVGLLVGILIGIPLTLGGLVIYRKGCFGLLNRGNPADRSLYNRADFADDIHI